MDVGTSSNDSLNRIEIADDEMNPFLGWSDAKIMCYRIAVAPQMVTNVIGTHEETYLDEDGTELTRTVEDTETVPTGKFYVTMMTPYVPSNLIDKISSMQTDITDLQAQQAQQDLVSIELFEQAMEQEAVNNAQDAALVDIFEMMMGGGETA